MRQGWRWFGPDDPVSLDDVRQAGATDIVSALHHMPIGEVWTREAVAERQAAIEAEHPAPLRWSVVESIPVPDDVKREGATARAAVEAWIASLEAVAACGIRVVCYNFMPVVDWCRTDLDWRVPNGAEALRFDAVHAAVFDLHILQRPGADAAYTPEERRRADDAFDAMDASAREKLTMAIVRALPGSTSEPLTVERFRDKVVAWRAVDAARLRANLVAFLQAVTPAAEAAGVRLTLHPDDPPRPLFGLPRIASTAADYEAILAAVPSPANGVCFCTGSLSSRPDNDLAAMARRLAPRIAFAHLRSVRREDDGSFTESDHLGGDHDMIAVLKALLAENHTRSEDEAIVFRPDHGHRMLGDLAAGQRTNPGYTAIGRLRGLAELRGAIAAIAHGWSRSP